jgi:hypothetical protein
MALRFRILQQRDIAFNGSHRTWATSSDPQKGTERALNPVKRDFCFTVTLNGEALPQAQFQHHGIEIYAFLVFACSPIPVLLRRRLVRQSGLGPNVSGMDSCPRPPVLRSLQPPKGSPIR